MMRCKPMARWVSCNVEGNRLAWVERSGPAVAKADLR